MKEKAITLNEQQDLFNNSYSPAFFRMKIDIPSDLSDLSVLDVGPRSLYFHEYLHFIQDISTTYGLMNMANTAYYVADAAYNYGKQKDNEFIVPHEIKKRYNDSGYFNHKVWEIYRGSSINPMRKHVTINSRPKIVSRKIEGNRIEWVQFRAHDNDLNKDFEFKLGGNIVCEGMAYFGEQLAFFREATELGVELNEGADFPYTVCFQIAKQIYPELADNLIYIIAACDIALMNYNPGLMFVRLLEHYKKKEILQQTTEEKDNVVGRIADLYKEGFAFIDGHQYDFETMQRETLRLMRNYYKTEAFEVNNEWLTTVFDRIRVFRKKIPQFATDIVLINNIDGQNKNWVLALLMRCVGTPLTLNDIDECTYTPPEGFNHNDFIPELFWAINQFYYIFTGIYRKWPCQLKKHCSESPDTHIRVDERCDRAPWEHCTDTEGLCPVGAMWRHWGLTGKCPKIKS